MYAEKKEKHHAGNISYINENIGVLKTAAIYGSNASGKTNLIMAFDALTSMIVDSGNWKDGDAIECHQPYLLSEESKYQPTEFEIEFFVNGNRYRYYITYDHHNILFEKLDVFSTARPTNLFTRTDAVDWRAMKFGDAYKGGRRLIPFFRNNSYLSRSGNTPDSPEAVRDVFNFFRKKTAILLTNQRLNIIDWQSDNDTREVISHFLKEADFGISRFEVEKIELSNNVPSFPDDMPDEIKKAIINDLSKIDYFYHYTDNGNTVRFTQDMESLGTRRLYEILPAIFFVLKNGMTLFMDEIERSFHPHMAELIIKIFNDPIVNINNAQLIYTTHDLSLMASEQLRRDQIYLAEKNVQNGTEYICLDDFDSSLKDNSPFSKWYTEGKLGGIPKINYSNITRKIKEALDNA
jgi:AAA15 family ATPase/GTPase